MNIQYGQLESIVCLNSQMSAVMQCLYCWGLGVLRVVKVYAQKVGNKSNV